jgi:hypothetical protein
MERRFDTRFVGRPHFGVGSDEVRRKARADRGTEQLRLQRFPLPSVQDCYHCANRCLEMWNDSADHAARSRLLRMADAWLRLASESDKPL